MYNLSLFSPLQLNMKILRLLFICLAFSSFQVFASDFSIPELPWTEDVGAQTRPSATKIFSVNSYGAKGDGETLNTKAIQKAIDAAAKKGGIVTFKPGKYVTGSIYVKSNVTLRIDKDVEIWGSQNIEDYPEINTRVAGLEMVWPSALINVNGQENVSIEGEGLVDGRGAPFWEKYWTMRSEYEAKGLRWIVDYDCKRPRGLVIAESKNVTLSGITLKNPGFWTVHLLYSEHITVDGISIRNNEGGRGPSTDGVDIDSSSKILVQNTSVDCNDDNFCLKAGRDWDGLRVNRPTEYVVIHDCTTGAGSGLITCGSETSGGIRNILAYNLKANGTPRGLLFKSAITRGGTVENIYFRDCHLVNVRTMLEATCNWNPSYSYSTLPEGYTWETLPAHWKAMLTKVEPEERGIPHFKNVYIQNITVEGAQNAINAVGMEQAYLENFYFNNVTISANRIGSVSYADGWGLQNFTFNGQNGDGLQMSNVKNITIK